MSASGVVVRIDASRIVDWPSFHEVFARALGFPDFYGRNLDAWNDCMAYLDDPEAGMTSVHVHRGGVVTLLIDHASEVAARCPEQYAALIECSSFVNWRRLDQGAPSVLALAFYG